MTDFTALIHLIMSLSYALPVLITFAFLTPVERKVLSYMQARKGPNIIGSFGLLQLMADGMKLFIKEPVCPSTSSPFLFIMTPVLPLRLAITVWTRLPLPFSLTDLNLGVLFLLPLSSLAV